jgi:hypothetical protein
MKVGSETDIPKSANLAVNGTHNAVRLSSASLAERSVLQREPDGSVIVDRCSEEQSACA